VSSDQEDLPFIYLMRQMGRALFTSVQRELTRFRVTPPQMAVLVAIDRTPGASAAQLAETHFMTPQSMGALIADLMRAGLLTRHPHPHGGRALQVELTEAGREVLAAAKAAMVHAESQLLAGLEPGEQEALKALLTRCVAAMQSDGG
jgi:DNA-binding MarR family transcriptional regulator